MLAEPVNHPPFHHHMRRQLRSVLSKKREQTQGRGRGKFKDRKHGDRKRKNGADASQVNVVVTGPDDDVKAVIPRNVSFAPQLETCKWDVVTLLVISRCLQHGRKLLV